MELIDGKKIAADIRVEIKAEVDKIIAAGKKVPHLAAIIVGNDAASDTYVTSKAKTCDSVGFDSTVLRFDASITEADLLAEVKKINNNDDIDGLIVQLPLPKHINENLITETIWASKDVDGFHPTNVGKLALGLDTYISATPYGIIELLDRYNIKTEGKRCVIVGRSHIVGSPVSILMARNDYPGNATVTLTHSKTVNLKEICLRADILIVAIGREGFITGDMVKEGAVVIDVGIHRVPSTETKSGFKLKGDVDFATVGPKASFITPVPGGVGPMTIASLMRNTLQAVAEKNA
ncbi:MAG: bifunctional 5,10-methylene-tetrahydrofolate dehydrogenase/5,10-methylene-tetrahydrofolate cyclohydrolase [Flavobacteriales bacterium]|nr:bifunctional 5,10-methylene-tetrahydrofolate dehydrogenase/5,10-methylene-tetrahydrofolate cyclohydrolase [Flavobacteriales bacterium]